MATAAIPSNLPYLNLNLEVTRPSLNPLGASVMWTHPTFIEELRMGVEGLFDWSSHSIWMIGTQGLLVSDPTDFRAKVLKVAIYAAAFFLSPYLLAALVGLSLASRWAYQSLTVITPTETDLAIMELLYNRRDVSSSSWEKLLKERSPALPWLQLLTAASPDVALARNLWEKGDYYPLHTLIELSSEDPQNDLPLIRTTQFPAGALCTLIAHPALWRELAQMEPVAREANLKKLSDAYGAKDLSAIRALLSPGSTTTTDIQVTSILLPTLLRKDQGPSLIYKLAEVMKEEGAELSRWTLLEKAAFYLSLYTFILKTYGNQSSSLLAYCSIFNAFLTGKEENDALIISHLQMLAHYEGRIQPHRLPNLEAEGFAKLEVHARQAILEGIRLRLTAIIAEAPPYYPIYLRAGPDTQKLLLADPEVSALLTGDRRLLWITETAT